MNRKLHNTILAFSATGLVLAVGLMSARPLPSHTAVPAGMIAQAQPAAASLEAAAVHAADALATAAVAARLEAHSRRFEADMTHAASVEHVLAATTDFITAVTTDAVLGEATLREATKLDETPPPAAPRKPRSGSVRGTIAVPYFSFARGMGRGDRS